MATLTSTNNKIKKSFISKDNILTIYSPKSCCIEIADTLSIDTRIIVDLPENSTVHLATKFQGQQIQTIVGPKTQRLWLTVLNECYFDTYKIQRGDFIGYLLFKPKTLKIKYEKNSPVKAWRPPNNYLPKDWNKNWKSCWQKKKEVSNSNG